MDHYFCQANDDIISGMKTRRAIALWVCAFVTAVVFAVCMYLLIFGGYWKDEDLPVAISIAFGPIAAFSVVVGFCAWWVVMFVLSLLSPNDVQEKEP